MRRVVRRLAESGGRASGTAFLAGLAVGAVVVVAVGQLLGSDAAIVRAAAVVPLIAALVMVGVAMAVGLSGASVAPAEPAAAAPESAEGRRTDGPATADVSDPFASADASDPRHPGDPPDTGDLLDPGDPPDAGDPRHAQDLPHLGDPPDPGNPPDAPPLPPDPPPGEPVTHTSVVEAWAHYRRNGDGFFTAQGLQRQFGTLGVAARVRDGSDVDAGGDVLVVEADPPDPDGFFVVPSFVKSPGAAPEWFDDAGDGALSARTQTIHKLAEGKWTDTSFAVVQKGSIS